jgi:hypothetical protein
MDEGCIATSLTCAGSQRAAHGVSRTTGSRKAAVKVIKRPNRERISPATALLPLPQPHKPSYCALADPS